MNPSTVISKKKRGPAPTGKGAPVLLRLQPELLAALDAFATEQKASRPEAVRRILKDFLIHYGVSPPES